MDDTIRRQAAIDAAERVIERDTSGNNDVVKAMEAWKSYIEALPSAQPEIVRCKDCVYHAGWDYCEEVDGLWYDDDYCCHGEKGERREE